MENRKNSTSFQIGFVFVLTTLFIALCLFVPVWQSATSSKLEKMLAKEEVLVNTLEEQKMVLTASIESQQTPEYVMKTASAKNLSFSQISYKEDGAVASSR